MHEEHCCWKQYCGMSWWIIFSLLKLKFQLFCLSLEGIFLIFVQHQMQSYQPHSIVKMLQIVYEFFFQFHAYHFVISPKALAFLLLSIVIDSLFLTIIISARSFVILSTHSAILLLQNPFSWLFTNFNFFYF